MPVLPTNDGLQSDNRKGKRTTHLVTVDELKKIYLTGLDITDPNTGKQLEDEVYQTYIDNAVAQLEIYLDIAIHAVTNYEEHRDHRANDYAEFGIIMLNNYPVIQVNSMELTYFRDAQGLPEAVFTIPNNWIRIQNDGILRLLPNAKFPGGAQLSSGGFFYPELLRSQALPHAWLVNYDFGFAEGCIPTMINSVVAKLAAMQAMIVGGNLVLGAGIASSSISVDGISQAIQTTQSPENSAFSATIKEYSASVFGRSKGDPFSELRMLYNYYKGQQFSII